MRELFASGRIIDLILAMTVLEAGFLVACRRLTGRGIAPAAFLGNLLSGVCLLVAVRLALTQAWWGWIALALLAALLAHLADLGRLWRG